MPPNSRAKIGRYEILGDLAVGGMAEILLARLVGPSGFERLVVIKRIFKHLAKDAEFVSMFLDEAKTVARISHPNVVQVFELGQEEGDLFLAMEYLEGESVSGLMRRLWARSRSLDPYLAAHIVAEACRGLQTAHDLTDDDGAPLDLVHRDVSPQNLFLTYAGGIKVLDFGIAKVANRSTKTEPGRIKGKFAYMSPEQCLAKHIDRRSDVFSLGIVLYELLTHRRLFARETEMLTLRAVCEASFVPPSQLVPSVPEELDAVCAAALARRKEERPSSCAELRALLLGAMRSTGRSEDPEQLLAALMRELYADRIEEKRELVRRARLGADIGSAPTSETDTNVELPRADEATVPTVSESDSRAARPAARSGWLKSAGIVVAIALATAALARTVFQGSAAPALPEASAVATTAPVPAESALPPARPSETAEMVAIEVTAVPAATVRVDGRVVGETPVTLQMARGPAPALVTVSRRGFLPYEQKVVPDAQQRLVVTLIPERGGPARRAPSAAPAAPPASPKDTGPRRPEML